MSPEQVQGKPLDPRSDVYAMGVLVYEMLCGVKPFTSSSLTGLLTAHITETPKPPAELRPEVGAELNEVILRCLAKAPEKRFASAGALLKALDAISSTAP
jgi:serine/threonine-protein kinase